MAKSAKRKKKPTSAAKILKQSDRTPLLERFDSSAGLGIFAVALFLGIILLYKPIVFEGLDSRGVDVLSSAGNTHQVKLYEKASGDRALWNPFMFGGTPIYHRHNPVTWSLDTFIWQIDALLDWRVWYMFLSGLGMFLLARYLGATGLAAMAVAVAYTLLPHTQALITVGHFAKVRALTWLPLVMLSFFMLLERRDLLRMFLFTFAFALFLRTQHYQIVFYGILLLAVTGIWPYLKMAIEKRWGDFLRFNGLFVAAMALVVLIVAQPLFVTSDYAPYSTRGGQAIDLQETQTEQEKKGVGFDYATGWSYSTAEFWNLIVPKFHGGTSDESIQLARYGSNRFPAYWGDLPFTQSYEYLSVLIAFLALIAIVFRWDSILVRALTILVGVALLLSLGKNFEPLYKLFFYYLPYFDKFRVPMMILTLVSFGACLLAALGLSFILRGGLEEGEAQKKFYYLGGGFLVLLLIPFFLGNSFSLSPAGELERYTTPQHNIEQARQLVNSLRAQRLEVLTNSIIRTLIFFLMGAGLILLAARQPAQRTVAGIGLFVLIALDLGTISTAYLDGRFVNLDRQIANTYRENELDRMVKQDQSLYRVVPPLRELARDSRYTYHYQSIGGYSAAKLQLIQDIISNNLVSSSAPGMPLNLNIINMMNGKYIFANQLHRHPDLQYLGSTQQRDLHVFRNNATLPRAFFVDSVKVITDGRERLQFMNSTEFNPAGMALLEKAPAGEFSPPESGSSAKIATFTPDKLVLETNKQDAGLLVLSEVYYPEGWQAFLGSGEELEIYKTNHLLRSVLVPGGKQTVTFTFEPTTYTTSVQLSWIGWLITYAGLLFLLYREYGERLRARFTS